MDMELTYIYHSGFALSGDGFTVIMDYYRDSEDGQAQADLNRLMDGTFSNQETGMPEGTVHSELLRRPGKLYVLASHFHPDHFNKEVLQWREQRPDIIYIFSKDILRHRRAQSGKKIFHAGDLNNWHWMDESTEAEWKGAEKNFLHELDDLYAYTPEVDVAMFPVDPRLGKEYMRGAGQFVTKIKTHIFVPMHFTPEYAKANAFRDFAEAHGVRFVSLTHRGQKIEIE